MSTLDLVLFQILNPVDQEIVVLLKDNAGTWQNTEVRFVSIPALLFALFEFWFVFFNFISVFVVLDLFLEEDFLAVSVSSWEAIQHETSVSAVVLVQSLLEKFVKELTWKSDFDGTSVNFRRFFVSVVLTLASSLNLLNLSIFELFNLILDFLDELIFRLLNLCHLEGFIAKFLDVNSWNIVVITDCLRIEGLSGGWRSTDSYSHWLEVSGLVELNVQFLGVSNYTFL